MIPSKTKLSRKYAEFVLRFRWLIIGALLMATLLAAFQIKYIDIRNDPDTLLPPSNRYVATNLYTEHSFYFLSHSWSHIRKYDQSFHDNSLSVDNLKSCN
jgi:predicted RND superfamily exporter protein